MTSTPQISFKSEFLQPDLVRVDVMATNLPAHFLGTAFDLVLGGDWQFDRAELCGIFARGDANSSDSNRADSNIFHLVSPQPQTHRVVFGLAVAGGGLDHPADGCVASFYFQLKGVQQDQMGDQRRISFERTTLSVYDSGRRDVSGVQWKNAQLNIYESPFQNQATAPVPSSAPVSASVQSSAHTLAQGSSPASDFASPLVPAVSQQQNSLFDTVSADLFGSFDSGVAHVYLVMGVALGLVLAIFCLLLLYCRLRRKP